MLVANASGFSTNIVAQGYAGLMGLGPNTGSLVRKELDAKDSSGDAVMDRIFEQNVTSQNYITFMLDRRGDPGNNITGQFTISEVVAGYESILQQPKLSIVTVPGLTDEDQHWQIYTDKNGVIGPDGEPIETSESIVTKSPDGQLVAVFDSGFTLPQVCRIFVILFHFHISPLRRSPVPCPTRFMVVSKEQNGTSPMLFGLFHAHKCSTSHLRLVEQRSLSIHWTPYRVTLASRTPQGIQCAPAS